MEIRSYRGAFHYERRIYRVPNTNWDVPGAPTINTVVYFVCTLFSLIGLSFIPPFSIVLGVLDWPMYPIAAGLVTWWATSGDFDGRKGHQFLRDILSYYWRNRPTYDRSKQHERKVYVFPDLDCPDLQTGKVIGPGLVHFNVPVALTWKHGKQVLRADNNGDKSTLILFPREKVITKP